MESHLKTVLVVDDNEPIREIISQVLGSEGYTVIEANNGAEALVILTKTLPGVILLDMRMPVLDGWAFAQAYRERPGPHAPIVVCTAARDAALWSEEIAAEGCLPKPFNLDDLVQIVGRFAAA
jgi:CheY-like chemotaxis protein